MILAKNITFLFNNDLYPQYKKGLKLDQLSVKFFKNYEDNLIEDYKNGKVIIYVDPDKKQIFHVSGPRKGHSEGY